MTDSKKIFSEKLALEKRVLLDAAVAATVATADGAQAGSDQNADTQQSNNADGVDAVTNQGSEDQNAFSEQSNKSVELVFIDENVADYKALVNDILKSVNIDLDAQALNQLDTQQLSIELDDKIIKFYTIDADENGIDKITNTLSAFDSVDAMHILSHANAGEMILGDIALSSENLADYQASFQGWQSSLSTDADILVYGCNLAQNTLGVEFINDLSELTQADVSRIL